MGGNKWHSRDCYYQLRLKLKYFYTSHDTNSSCYLDTTDELSKPINPNKFVYNRERYRWHCDGLCGFWRLVAGVPTDFCRSNLACAGLENELLEAELQIFLATCQ